MGLACLTDDAIIARSASAGPPDQLSSDEPVATADGNDWTPAIAASEDGQVAVGWDSYTNGNYDVSVRTWHGGTWGQPRVIAATLANEARASLVVDRRNQLWIAYEVCPEGWGKDFGPYDQSPKRTPLYRARSIGVKVLDGATLRAPESDVNRALPMPCRSSTRRILRISCVIAELMVTRSSLIDMEYLSTRG